MTRLAKFNGVRDFKVAALLVLMLIRRSATTASAAEPDYNTTATFGRSWRTTASPVTGLTVPRARRTCVSISATAIGNDGRSSVGEAGRKRAYRTDLLGRSRPGHASAGNEEELTDAQKETLKRWIAAGAEYQPHWSFIRRSDPIHRP